jgi:hypothetical protein
MSGSAHTAFAASGASFCLRITPLLSATYTFHPLPAASPFAATVNPFPAAA